MLITITDMYNAFLRGIDKEKTSTVFPSQFNLIINEAYDQWLREKVDESDLIQKRIDDLQSLRYITDGSLEVLVSSSTVEIVGGEVESDVTDPVTGIRTVVVINTDPEPDTVTTTVYQILIPLVPDSNGLFLILPVKYPGYFRLQSLMSKVEVNGVELDYIGSKVYKSDRRSEILNDPYSKPVIDVNDLKRSRIYHQYIQNNLRLYLPDGAIAKKLHIEYVKVPKSLLYDPNVSANNVDAEVGSDQQQQIVDVAVRLYIERTENVRYRTTLNEDQIKQKST